MLGIETRLEEPKVTIQNMEDPGFEPVFFLALTLSSVPPMRHLPVSSPLCPTVEPLRAEGEVGMSEVCPGLQDTSAFREKQKVDAIPRPPLAGPLCRCRKEKLS